MKYPSRLRRKARITYAESDSDMENQTITLSLNPRPTRSSRHVTTYHEESDDTLSSDNSDPTSSDGEIPPRRHNVALKATRIETTPVKPLRPKRKGQTLRTPSSFSSFKRRKMTSAKPAAKEYPSDHVPLPIHTTGIIPPWQQLPYQILLNIVQTAAYPLLEKASRSSTSIDWLCGLSRLCKSFHEVCVAALLYSPPLYPAYRAHGLLALLKGDQAKLTTNYRNKIKSLDIEVKALLIRKSGIDLEEFLDYTPLLENLKLYHNHDDYGPVIWAQPWASKDRWSYPKQLFEKLEVRNILLESFEWNGRFPSTKEVLSLAPEIHENPSFSQLHKLSLVNMLIPEKASEAQLEILSDQLLGSLRKLSFLRSLRFRNCNIVNDLVMPFLPPGLQHLTLINCQNLTSSAIEQYLKNADQNLRNLVLHGNQSMSLGFLANLKTFSPRLENLSVDLTYTDPTSYRDRDPLYDEVLPNGPPTWPGSLISLSVENLRQLSADDAEDFLTSLVNAADDLPYLNSLIIKAILNGASWRDRAEMRKKWIPALETVFLNTATPKEHCRKPASNLSNRQSTRLAKIHPAKSNGTLSPDDSDAATSQSSRTRFARQGRCDIVQLIISDQRPAQEQYHEADFLDDEPSGDEEWTGRGAE